MRKQQPVPKGALALFLLVAIAFLGGCGGRSRSTTWTEMLVSDGVIYAADLDQVHALEAESGEVLWSFPPEPDSRSYGPFHTVTLLPGEALFVTSQERVGSGFFAQPQGILRALSIEGNRVLWEFRETRGEYAAGGAVANGILVIGNSDGNVYAISVEDGSLAWDSPFSTGNRVWSTPLIISDTVYVASMDHHLYALDLASGRERWERPFEAEGAMIGRPLALNDRFYVGAFDHKLYAVRQEDGGLVWEFEGENWFWGSPATDGTTIYVADVDGNVYAVDAETGEEEWRQQVGETVRIGPVLARDEDLLLVAGNIGTLYGLDASSGDVVWSEGGEGYLASLGTADETFYVSRIYADQHIQAFRVAGDDITLEWGYPPPEAEE